jgi:hypothetical protein
VLGLGTDRLCQGLSIAVEHDEWDAVYASALGQPWLLVDIDLADLDRRGALIS